MKNSAMNPPLRRSFLPVFALFILLIGGLAPAAQAQSRGEYIIVSGGPSLRKWENYRRPGEQHDRWWGNFIRPARMRIEEIEKQDPSANITWMVFHRSFVTRSSEDKRSLIELVNSVRDKYHIHLVWFESGDDVISYLNNGQNRGSLPICDFEYFGHSNKYCFMFDYSNAVYGSSIAWLHQKDLGRINRGIFTRDAFCKSWGCHTGESMSKFWRKATGVAMIGADGKTDYSDPMAVVLSPGGHWTKG
jgi:hypothetical protein